jgi:hypothetical protein
LLEIQKLNDKNKTIEAEISRVTKLKEDQAKSSIDEINKAHSIEIQKLNDRNKAI